MTSRMHHVSWRRFKGMAQCLLLTLGLAVPPLAVGQGVPPIEDEPNAGNPILALDTGGHTNAVYKLMVSDYTRQLVSVGLDKTIRLWDLETGEPVRVLRPPIASGAHGYLFSAALSPDGKLLAAGTYRALTPLYDHRIHLIDLSSGQMIHSLKGHSYTIYDLAFSPDGEKLASASHDGTVRIWNVATGQSLQVLKGHEKPVHGVAWSAGGKRVASASLDKTCRIWSLESGAATAVMREAQGDVNTIGWSPDGKFIAAGSADKTIRLYDPNGRLTYQWPWLRNEVMSLKFAPDSKRLLYTYGSNTMPPLGSAILDLATGKQLVYYDGHENSPICCAFTPDGKTAVTGDSISRIRVWDAATGTTLRKLDGRGKSMLAAGWSPDGQAIAWGTHISDTTIDVGNALERTFCLRNLEFGPPPDKKFVRGKPQLGPLQMGFNVSEMPVNLRKVYFMKNNAVLNTFTLPQPYDQVRCYTLLPNEEAIVGTHDGAYHFDIKNGLVQRHMTDRGEELWGLAPSPDFRYVLTAGNDQVMRVWKIDTGDLVVALFVADEEWIAWTPQGYYAASFAGESLMGWHINRGPASMSDFYAASRFHKSLYRPDVIRRLLQTGDLTQAVEQADRERNQQTQVIKVTDVLPAEVKITDPAVSRVEQKEAKITVKATAQAAENQQLTDLRLIINGRPFGAPKPVAAAPDAGATIERQWDVDLPPGNYSLAVKADTPKNYALSRPVEVSRPAGETDARPKQFVLAIGAPPNPNSAAAIAKAMSDASQKSSSETVSRVLTGNEATPEAIAAELEKIRGQATLADTTLIYYAGQESLDMAGHYQLAAAGGGISEQELKQKLAAISGRILLAVDATRSTEQFDRQASMGFCASSDAVSSGGSLDVAASDFFRELLTEDYGVVVLRAMRSSSAAGGQSGASSFAQAFTEAVGGQADENKDGVVYLHELSRYVNQRVRELSGGKQTSVIERPHGVRSFPLVQPAK